MKSEICFHLQIRAHFDEFNSQDVCALWVGPQQSIGPFFGNDSLDLCIRHLSAELEFVRYVSSADGDSQQFMFVGDIEVVNDPKRLITSDRAPISCVVRLHPLDYCLGRSGNSLYYSVVFGSFKLLCPQAHRELNLKSGFLVTLQNKSPYQVVKTGSKMMNNFTNENGKAQGDFLTKRDEIARFVVAIDVSNDAIIARIDKSSDLGFEIFDILVSPLYLCPTPVQ
jgi:hypothetical protein